jgi:hypothetical protein
MMLLTHPTKSSHGNGGVMSRRVSTQAKLMEEVNAKAKEKRVMATSQAVEKADHDRVSTDVVIRKISGTINGERMETRVKSHKPGQFRWTCSVLALRRRRHRQTKTVSQMVAMRLPMQSSPFSRLREAEVCALRPDT